jgi:hypothetical protein
MKRDVIRRKAIEPKSSTDGEPDSRDGGVQSVDRALSIIEVLAEDDEGYRLTDLACAPGYRPRPCTACWRRWRNAASFSSTVPNRNGMSAPELCGRRDLHPPPQFYGAGDAVFAQAARPYP